MEFKSFTVADLGRALQSEDFWRTKVLPITKQRAWSLCHNPRAEEEDPVLLVAYQDNHVAGYLGILPDKIFFDNADHSLGWLTGWWVDPCLAGKGVGAILLYKALNAYRDRLGVSGGSKEARKALHASQRFITLKPLKGLDIRFRFNATSAVLRKFPSLKILRVGFKVADVLLDEIVNLRGFFWERRTHIRQRLAFEYVSFIDAETSRFIERHYHHDLTRKGKAELDWIMTYPWVVSAPQKDSASRRYFFSSTSARFFFLSVKVFEQNNGMIGFLMLSVRNERMRVVYSHFEDRHAPSIAAAAVYHALAMDVSILSLYDERLVKSVIGLRCPFWSTQSMSRGFFLSKAFADFPLADCRLHGGDGDFAFY
jgi:GNAT superfamily N-acetyltransferase